MQLRIETREPSSRPPNTLAGVRPGQARVGRAASAPSPFFHPGTFIRNWPVGAYIRAMPKFEFCIPTAGKAVPYTADWLHEIKYNGYRLRLERDGNRVRLITRGGYN